MTTVFNETKENQPAGGHVSRAEVVSGMSTPEKLIGRSCENAGIATPAKKRYDSYWSSTYHGSVFWTGCIFRFLGYQQYSVLLWLGVGYEF